MYLNEIGTCGYYNSPDISGSGCCIISLDETDYGSYLGSMDIFMDEQWDEETAAPIASNGQRYCKIQTSNPVNWQTAYYLDKNQCIDQIKCFNQELHIFADGECTVANYTFQLDEIPSAFHTAIGNLTVSSIIRSNGRNVVDWYTFQPSELLIPTHKNAVELLGLIGYILAVITSVYSSFYYYKRSYQTKQERMLFIAVAQTLALLKVIAGMVYVYTIFIDYNNELLVHRIADALGINFLMWSLLSGSFLLKIFNVHSKVLRIAVYAVLVLVFLGTNTLYWLVGNSVEISNNLSEYIPLAMSLRSGYTIFLFVFDTLPVVSLLYMVVKQNHVTLQTNDKKLTTMEMIVIYKPLIFIFLVQMLILWFYVFTSIVVDYQYLVDNDRSMVGTMGTQTFFVEAHTLTSIVLYEYLKYYTKELVQPSGYLDTPKRKMLMDIYNSSIAPKGPQDKTTVKASQNYIMADTSSISPKSNRDHLGSFFSQVKLTSIAPEMITPPSIITLEPPARFTESELQEQEQCFESDLGMFTDAINVPARHYSQYGKTDALKQLKSDGFVQRKLTRNSIVQSVHSLYENKTLWFCCR
ncbi:hypothetical protein HDV01_001610 [Terramyces sp. JEL0728]|nr:hypothetical protein HDV01_001610 [Terramyces sp. JEL0728]